MRIPKSFNLAGQTITVEYDDNLTQDTECAGIAKYKVNKILLQPAGAFRPQVHVESTFCHEFTHFLLYYAASFYKSNSDHLHQDEHLVDMVGQLLHQALISMEYEAV